MDYTHRVTQANDIPDAPPTRGQYDESAIRTGALEMVIAQHRAEIKRLTAGLDFAADETQRIAQMNDTLRAENKTLIIHRAELGALVSNQADEIERLNGAIGELEREELGQDFIDRHNACETPRSGRTENFWN